MLKKMQLYSSCRPLDVVSHWRDNDMLLLSPPYQRGDVWGPTRRRNLIRSLLLGIPIPSIVVNDRMKADWPEDQWVMAVIDGKQRLTTILQFLDSKLSIPREWIDDGDGMVTFAELPIARQRRIENSPLTFAEGALPTIGDEIEVFELINFGGVAQGDTDPVG